MGLLNFFRETKRVADLQLLRKQLLDSQARGLTYTEACASLIVHRWQIPRTLDSDLRTLRLSQNLGEADLVIGFLIFSERIGVHKAVKDALLNDPFYHLYGGFYATALPLTDFASKHLWRPWNESSGDLLGDSVYAAFYASLAAPCAIEAWIIVACLPCSV